MMSHDQTDIEVQTGRIRYDFTNAQSFERTAPTDCTIDGTAVKGKNWVRILVAIVERELAGGNPAVQALYHEPLTVGRADRPFLMEARIEGLNCAELSNGFWINVNWSIPRLLEMIRAFCLRCGYSKEQIVLYGVPKKDASAKRDSSPGRDTTGRSISMERAETFLKDAGLRGAAVQDLIDALRPGASLRPTKDALDNNLNIIAMPRNRYVHTDCFVDLDEAEEALGRILRAHFAQFGGYSNSQLIFGAARQELSLFLNDNDCENADAVYAVTRYLFEKRAAGGGSYIFSPPHIFEREPDYPMTLKGLMVHLARDRGGILRADDAKDYLRKTMLAGGSVGQLLQIGTDSTFLMYDEDSYLLSETLGIDEAWCEQMHRRMDDLFRRANVAYVIPRDISEAWLAALPALPQNLGWTRLLLQEVLDKYPAIGFHSISADITQLHHTLSAAFVPVNSPLQSFPDVVTLFMEEKHALPMRMPGEELRMELREAGMLENNELIFALPKALDDYRFAWTDGNQSVYIRGNRQMPEQR